MPIDDAALGRNDANFAPLTPLSFIQRAAAVYPDHPSVIYGSRRYAWKDTYERAVRLASALQKRGVGKGDVVAFVAPNIPELVEAHFGVAMAGAVLNAINTRLDADTIAYILTHGEAKVLVTDAGFAATIARALEIAGRDDILVVDILDREAGLGDARRLGALDYEALLSEGDPDFAWTGPADEWDAMCLNYTSGTSGRPKGVLYHHRGAYLIAMGTAVFWPMPLHPRYLYVVPMFHCNGWGHAWMMAAQAGTIICLRTVAAAPIYQALAEHDVTHFGGAPIVLSMLINAKDEERRPLARKVEAFTAGAPPPAAVLEAMERLGFGVTQVYGLTETFGHVVGCAWNQNWDDLPFSEKATIKARQGVSFTMNEGLDVVDVGSRAPVPADGETLGEVVIRGNTVMKGYYKNEAATAEAFEGGWFRSGDLAVKHPDGYVEIKDRLKDVIISGGENISSVEVEGALYRHPSVAHAAVVAMPDAKWGESPCAFVELKDGAGAEEAELIGFVREAIAHYKAPKKVVFETLPKTATGKIKKFELRARAKELA